MEQPPEARGASRGNARRSRAVSLPRLAPRASSVGLRLGLALALLVVSPVLAGEDLKSGPQKLTMKIGAFNPLHCSGPDAGKRSSLIVSHGANPVILIFARDLSEPLIQLVKKVDEATGKHAAASLGSFVVLCSEDKKSEERLKDLATKLRLKHCVLTLLERKAGPNGYHLHPDAEVSVVLYVKRNPRAQFAYKKGELQDKDVEVILAEVPKILPAKK